MMMKLNVDFKRGRLYVIADGLSFSVDRDLNVYVETKKSKLSLVNGELSCEVKKQLGEWKVVDERIVEGIKKRSDLTYLNN